MLCVSDADCDENCNRSGAGQGCCARASSSPTCGGPFNASVVCDPNGNENLCRVVGGNCRDNLGGEAEGQSITLDERVNSRSGNPDSQGGGTDGFFLRAGTDVIVLVVRPYPSVRAVTGSAAGFLLSATCQDGRRACLTDSDCPRPSTRPCRRDFASRIVVEAIAGQATAAAPRRPIPTNEAGAANVLRAQTFLSSNNKLYYVLRANPAIGNLGAQVTSLMATDGEAVAINEPTDGPLDGVVTSLATSLSGEILGDISTIRRTPLITGLPSNVIEDQGNPLNGDFDPFANGGDGLITLPGGTRTVSFEGTTGTEPMVPLAEVTGAGPTLVPAAAQTRISRRAAQQSLLNRPTIVFPWPPAPLVTSRGAVCGGGPNDGAACDFDARATATDICVPGTCADVGGHSVGQNVTLDAVVGRRIGNPAAQPDAADGFFLRNETQLMVFAVNAAASRVGLAASGFAVTGTCSDVAQPCAVNADCPTGFCSDSLTRRDVIAATGTPSVNGNIANVQTFISDENQHYILITAGVGDFLFDGRSAQVTNLAFSGGIVSSLNENANNPPDPVVTSVSATAALPRVPPLANIKRTDLITGLVSPFVQNMGNPLNGDFDPAANNGTGLLTLPGGSRTVAFTNSGTEALVDVVSSTGAGVTFVPAAATVSVARRLGLRLLSGLTSLVFPNPPGPIVTSAGATCAGGETPGAACDPANGDNDCDGGTCTNFGGERDGQNVTLDDTLGSRIGNPLSQGNNIDGFHLQGGTQMIVFLVDGGDEFSSLQVAVSGFVVTGTCSNSDTSCTGHSDCTGGTCGEGLAQRRVLPPFGGGASVETNPTPTASPTATSAATATATSRADAGGSAAARAAGVGQKPTPTATPDAQ